MKLLAVLLLFVVVFFVWFSGLIALSFAGDPAPLQFRATVPTPRPFPTPRPVRDECPVFIRPTISI